MSKDAGHFTSRKLLQRVAAALFWPYLLVLTLLFVVKQPAHFWMRLCAVSWDTVGANVQFVPGRTILYYLTLQENYRTGFAQLGGNLLGFAPFGFLLPLFFRPARHAGHLAMLAFSCSLGFELLQYITNFGSFDVDDVILNTSGAVCGFFLLRWILKTGV